MRKILYLGLDPSHQNLDGDITHWPIIQIVPRSIESVYHQICNFDEFSHVIFTSKNSINILLDYLKKLKIIFSNDKKIITVGKRTASNLMKYNLTPKQIAKNETAEGVVEILGQLSLDHAHIFWPHSSGARSVIKDYLITRNLKFTTCILYDTYPQEKNRIYNLEIFEEIVFTSPSTIDAFLYFFGSLPKKIKLSTIGPITSQYLKAQLFQAKQVSKEIY